MQIQNALITGSFSYNGADLSNITSSNAYSASLSIRTTNLESTASSLVGASSSFSSRTTQVERTYASTGSNTFTGVQNFSNTCNPIGFNSVASVYTAGGLQVTYDSYFSSSVFVNGNLTVFGTQSVVHVSSSQFNIGTNIITVNTSTPSIRYGGLSVYDSGSTGLSGSILWDSELNRWIYANASGSGGGATYGGGMFISGPRNAQGLGCEQGTTSCMLLVGQGGDHLTSSMIYHSSTITCVGSNATISSTGIAYFNGCVGIGALSGNGYRLEVTNPSCASGYVNAFWALHNANNTFTIKQFGASHPSAPYVNQIGVLNAEQHLHLVTDTQACIDAGTSTKGIFLRCGGLVGIGTQSPNRLLTINGDSTLLGNNYISTNKFLQWEGGAYWTTRVTSTGNQFEIYRGDTGASPFVINSCNLPIFTCQVCAPRVSLNSGTSGIIDLGQINTGGVANQIVGGQFSGYAYVGKLSFNVGTWGAGSDYGPTEQMRIEVQGADTKKSQITMAPYGGLIVSCGDSYFCGSTYGIMGFGCKVFDKICYIMTTTGTICVPLDGLGYGSGPTRAIYLYGTLLDNDAAHYAHMLYYYRNDYGGLQASTISQASLVHPSTAGQAYTFSVNDPVGLGKSNCTLNLRFTSSGAGVAPGSYCTKMRIVVYNVPGV